MSRKMKWLHHPYSIKTLHCSIWYCLSSVFYKNKGTIVIKGYNTRLKDNIRLRQQLLHVVRHFCNPIRMSQSFYFPLSSKKCSFEEKHWLVEISFVFIKKYYFFNLVIKLISWVKLFENKHSNAKMLNAEMMEKLTHDLFKQTYWFMKKNSNTWMNSHARVQKHFNNIFNISSIPNIVFV